MMLNFYGTILSPNINKWATTRQNQHNDVRQAKSQIILCIHTVWSESSLCAQWVANDPSFLHADSEDSDQTGRMPRLIWVFAGRTCHLVGFVMRRLKCLYEHSIAVIKLKVERYGFLYRYKMQILKKKRGKKETKRMFPQQGIEPESPAWQTNAITTTPRPLLVRLVK